MIEPLPAYAVQGLRMHLRLALGLVLALVDGLSVAIPHAVQAVLLDHGWPSVRLTVGLVFDAGNVRPGPVLPIWRLGVLDLVLRLSFAAHLDETGRRVIPKPPLTLVNLHKRCG